MTSFITPSAVSVHIVHLTAEGPRYLLIRRCSKYLSGTWQMVTGGIEEGETASEAALREIWEEVRLKPQALYSADLVETFYVLSHDKIAFVPVFIAFVEEMKVCLSAEEHDAYEWLTFEEAKNRLVWAEQKRSIAHIHECFLINKPHNLLRVTI